ncbi:MAG: YihA family ribosome biosis GTP-binding protein, partial [Devosia sp.]|nr:YihA family ribosome biosis GTP-binding protein [Devosia sp.]
MQPDAVDYSPDIVETGRLLFARPFVFVKGCVKLADLPPMDKVEIAFAGRSNVGKSSLI